MSNEKENEVKTATRADAAAMIANFVTSLDEIRRATVTAYKKCDLKATFNLLGKFNGAYAIVSREVLISFADLLTDEEIGKYYKVILSISNDLYKELSELSSQRLCSVIKK